ncbi:hypothetical protein ABT340_39400 [Streptosporangium sp. NPDC000239]|uniref:hypothetical protein n=1 Tax=Streptosporangium sp. NPDC000239 TaxID=3154248 RepID=UPI003331FBEF
MSADLTPDDSAVDMWSAAQDLTIPPDVLERFLVRRVARRRGEEAGPCPAGDWPYLAKHTANKTTEEPPMTADEFNATYPIATPVLAWPGSRDEEPLTTVTRTPAWTLGHGTPVVSVEGIAGGIALTHVERISADVRPQGGETAEGAVAGGAGVAQEAV